jgi:lysophospholipase
MTPEPVLIESNDGARLAGAYYAADQLRGQALLLHMMPAAKESWSAFASALAERGIASLAIDFRGHGASDGGPEGHKAFSEAQHQAKRFDVEAGLAWLRAKGSAPMLVAGASIGANLAIRAAAEHGDIAACLALSPGIDYRGVTTPDAAAHLRSGQKVLVAASEEDAPAREALDVLAASARVPIEVRRFGGANHGTAMFENDPAFFSQAVDWLSSAV